MAKEKQTRRMIAMALAAAVTMSSVPVVAFAEEVGGEGGTAVTNNADDSTTTTTGEGTMESPKVTVTVTSSETKTTEDGGSVEKVETKTETNAADESTGESVNSKEVKTETTETDVSGAVTKTTNIQTDSTTVDADGTTTETDVTKEETKEYDSDQKWESTDGFEEGIETVTKENTENVPDVTVQLKEGETTSASSEVSDKVVVTGPDTDKTDGEWDYTETTETTGREVTATMGNIETFKGDGEDVVVDENIETNLDAVNPEWNEEKEAVRAPITKFDSLEAYQEALKNKPDGYDFLYTGHGEDSFYGASWGFWNGSTSGYGTPVQQFQMTDLSDPSLFVDENGEFKNLEGEEWKKQLDIHTGYCVDVDTGSKSGYWYDIKNLEDAGYYKTEEAEDHIRAIALNGYWGTVGTQKDANGNDVLDDGGNPVPETGSLAAMQAMLKDAQANGDETTKNLLKDVNIDGLTEGEALVATQMAIWKYGNPYEPYTEEDGDRYEINFEANTLDMRIDRGHWTDWVSSGTGNDAYFYDSNTNELGMTDEQIDVSLARINAVYEYLIGLSKTAEEAGTTEIITEEKVAKVDSLNMTVGEKVEGHEANADDNDDNDVYNVSLNFALVVEPDKAKDDLVVKVVRVADDGQGNITTEEVAKARLAGDATNDEGFDSVVYDAATGSYTLSGLELAENSGCEFNLKLEGAQYLEQGVYIYSSEIRNDVPSQTFVGIAEGYKQVDVGMKVDLEFDVKEGTIKEKRSWRKTWNDEPENEPGGGRKDPETPKDPEDPKDPGDPGDPEDFEDISDNDVPLAGVDPEEPVDIGDEEVPLVAGEEEVSLIAQTGDSNHMAGAFGGMFAALAGMFCLRRKKED